MKKISVIGILFIIAGLFIAIGPHTIFPVCNSGKVMNCNRTANVEIYIGLTVVLEGILLIVFKSKIFRIIISLLGIISGIFTILVPTVMIGVCGNPHMNCAKLTRPILVVLGSLVIILSILYTIYLICSNKKKDLQEEINNE